MSKNLRELERSLLQQVGERLSRFGFSLQAKDQVFYRNADGVKTGAFVNLIRHANDFDANIGVAVRFDAVEDLVNRFNTLLSDVEKEKTFTLGAELGNLEKRVPFRVTVASERDISTAADALASKMATLGLSYIERYSDPEAAYNVLSKDDREAWLHSPIHVERAKRACVLLVVLGRPSEVRALGAQKLSFLKLNDPATEAFSKFLAQLNHSA